MTRFDDWVFWWSYNRDEILEEVGRARRPAEDPLLGRLLRKAAIPALRRAAETDGVHGDIRSGALIALGRAGVERALLVRCATGDEEQIVREGAIIGPGLLLQDEGGDRLARISTGYPWRASVPALDELLTILRAREAAGTAPGPPRKRARRGA